MVQCTIQANGFGPEVQPAWCTMDTSNQVDHHGPMATLRSRDSPVPARTARAALTRPRACPSEPEMPVASVDEVSRPAEQRKTPRSENKGDKLKKRHGQVNGEPPSKKNKTTELTAQSIGNPEDGSIGLQIEALPEEIKSRFGSVVWAKLGTSPYWPALILDPRLLPDHVQRPVKFYLEGMFCVCLYGTNDIQLLSSRYIKAWNDTKHKPSKRPNGFQEALQATREDVLLPVEKRIGGIWSSDRHPPHVDRQERTEESNCYSGGGDNDTEKASSTVVQSEELRSFIPLPP